MREWGASLLAAPDDSLQRWLASFAVLTYCRIAHRLSTGEIRSKRDGVSWAQRVFDRRWRALLDRAWENRVRTTEASHRPADPEVLAEVRSFVRHALDMLDRGGGDRVRLGDGCLFRGGRARPGHPAGVPGGRAALRSSVSHG